MLYTQINPSVFSGGIEDLQPGSTDSHSHIDMICYRLIEPAVGGEVNNFY
jgi:hypothetical protein